MTKSEMLWPPEIIPDFDVLEWKQEIQDQIYEEIKDMSTEEWLAYLRRSSERAERRRAEREKNRDGLD